MGNIIQPSEVRNFFIPYLESGSCSATALNSRIAVVEDYVSKVYFGGSYSSDAKYPCIMLVAADVLSDPSIMNTDTYGDIRQIGDLEFQPHSGRGSALYMAQTWRYHAYEILRGKADHFWSLYRAND